MKPRRRTLGCGTRATWQWILLPPAQAAQSSCTLGKRRKNPPLVSLGKKSPGRVEQCIFLSLPHHLGWPSLRNGGTTPHRLQQVPRERQRERETSFLTFDAGSPRRVCPASPLVFAHSTIRFVGWVWCENDDFPFCVKTGTSLESELRDVSGKLDKAVEAPVRGRSQRVRTPRICSLGYSLDQNSFARTEVRVRRPEHRHMWVSSRRGTQMNRLVSMIVVPGRAIHLDRINQKRRLVRTEEC
ncbi:TPT domain-containing protein [Psidium guajava]|nr:TPT domain-containing protein [Psidium guajava]